MALHENSGVSVNSDDNRFRTATIFFLLATLAYIAWRWSPFIVWDDTASGSFNKYVTHNFTLEPARIWSHIIERAFLNTGAVSYRPISSIIQGLGNAYLYSVTTNPSLFIIINGIICGFTALLFMYVSGFFVRSRAARLFATFLFFASSPVLTGSLVLFSGIQFLVFMFILLILAIYLRHDQDGRRIWLLPLALALIIGAWTREFVGLAPALIIVLEVINRRGFRLVGLLAAAGFYHAMFPTFLTSLFADNIPIVFVFNFGNLNHFMGTASSKGVLETLLQLKWRIFGHLFNVMPPSLMVLGFVTFCWSTVTYWKKSTEDFRQQLFLTIFFGAAFVPFLKVFHEQVHLAYSLIPLSLLLAKQVEFLHGRLARRPLTMPALGIAALVIITTADHAINIFAVRQATRDIYGTIMSIADRFTRELPPGSVVISNAHHIEDIRFYSKGHIEPWAVRGGMPHSARWMYTGDDLQKLIDDPEVPAVYMLDVRLPKIEGQRGNLRAHDYVRDEVVEMKSYGKIAAVNYTFPFFDPLRILIPTEMAIWPGPPDLVFDFYRGPALSGALFLREVAVDYMFYKVTGKKVKTWNRREWANNAATLDNNFHGFRLFGLNGRVYAIPKGEGAFEIKAALHNGYSQTFEGTNLKSVKNLILKATGNPTIE